MKKKKDNGKKHKEIEIMGHIPSYVFSKE